MKGKMRHVHEFAYTCRIFDAYPVRMPLWGNALKGWPFPVSMTACAESWRWVDRLLILVPLAG
jgi:hypothetical protein